MLCDFCVARYFIFIFPNLKYVHHFILIAPGNVAENVILERDTDSTVTFVEGAKESYLGYITLKVSFSYVIYFQLFKFSIVTNSFIICRFWSL